MSLHDVILNSIRGYSSIGENENYPEGIIYNQLFETSISFDEAKFLFIPADMVPESETSKRIVRSGKNLTSRYVVYREFRRGADHDSSYG